MKIGKPFIMNSFKTNNMNKFDTAIYTLLIWVLGFLTGYYKAKNK